MTAKKVDELFFLLFCEKNSDGTKHLRLRGREMYQRFGRRLSKTDMLPLAEFLLRHPEVITLDLAYNDLGDEGMKILAQEFFQKGNHLVYINLLHCDLQAEGLKWLSSAEHLNLKKIRLLGNKFGAEGARFIGRLIENCPGLENLDIGETDQTLESIESLLMMIEKSKLKSINISRIIPNNYYSKYNNSTLAEDLGILLRLNDSLEVMRAQKCEFDGHDVEILLGGLVEHTKLTLLDLGANNIGDHGIELIATWLKTRPNLLGLKLPANNIMTHGAKILSDTLPFSKIRILDIQDNKIHDRGMADLLSSIKKSTPLRILYIWNNPLGPITLRNLEFLMASKVLDPRYIDIRIYYVDGMPYAAYNPIDSHNRLAYSLQSYGAVPELRILRNKISHPCAQPRALINFEFIEYPLEDESPYLIMPRKLEKEPVDSEKDE